jgi:von Willebrand factor A domain-containing protein 7
MTKRTLLALVMAASLCAQNQVPHSNPGWPCVAGRAVDPSFVKAAEATGGQVFLFDRSEAARSLVLAKNTGKHEATIYRSMGTLSTGTREFSFPVDSTVDSLMVSISLQCLQSITVYRPGNTEVHGGEPDVDENRFKSGLILILARPPAGEWRIRMAGNGMFFAVISAKTPISLDSAEFVEQAGRPGHEGLFPVKGPTHIGDRRTVQVALRAPAGEKRFLLVDPAGETLDPLDLKSIGEDAVQSEFLGALVVKHSAFRVAVQGVDAAGYPYQRLLAQLLEASDSR